MAVTLAAGLTPKMTLNPFTSIQTLTGFIAQVSTGDLDYGSLRYQTLFAVGLTLFMLTFAVNLLARRFTRKFKEVYE